MEPLSQVVVFYWLPARIHQLNASLRKSSSTSSGSRFTLQPGFSSSPFRVLYQLSELVADFRVHTAQSTAKPVDDHRLYTSGAAMGKGPTKSRGHFRPVSSVNSNRTWLTWGVVPRPRRVNRPARTARPR